jgi:hypothetical protein
MDIFLMFTIIDNSRLEPNAEVNLINYLIK